MEINTKNIDLAMVELEVKKHSKIHNILNLFQFLTFFGLFAVISFIIVGIVDSNLFSSLNEGLNFVLKGAIALTVSMGLFFAQGNLFIYLERKNLEKLIKTEQKIGYFAMFNPSARYCEAEKYNIITSEVEDVITQDKEYFVIFYPFVNNLADKVCFTITEEEYNKYDKSFVSRGLFETELSFVKVTDSLTSENFEMYIK